MQTQIFSIIGLMSGSSLDGLDIALCNITQTIENDSQTVSFEILNSDCVIYTIDWQERLKNASTLSALNFVKLDVDFGIFCGEAVKTFIQNKINNQPSNKQIKINFVASHGHTVFHNPALGYSTQIGKGANIAVACGLPVYVDFRSTDVALGGQGAPLAPIVDIDLFPNYDFFLNLGGIANISAKTPKQNNETAQFCLGFDVCPANQILNYISQKINLPYDAGGQLAAKGTINTPLLTYFNNWSFYATSNPKSLDKANIEPYFFSEIDVFLLENKQQPLQTTIQNLLATCVAHITFQITQSIQQVSKQNNFTTENKTLLATGGGAFNTYLINQIQKKLNCHIVVPNNNLVQNKEALLMAYLGFLRHTQQTNTIQTVTGAKRNSIGGALYLP